MSEIVGRPFDTTRASDADRDRVLTLLSTATADGRLTVDEHSDLMSKTLHARTIGELAVITEDLEPLTQPAPIPAAPATSSRRAGMVAIFGARTRKGAWQVPTEFKATAVFGAVELDMRNATFDGPEVLCVANSVFGAIEITVPDWVRVIDEGTSIFGAREESEPQVDTSPTVTLRVRGFSAFGALEVRRRAPKRRGGEGSTLPPPSGPAPRELGGADGIAGAP